MLWILSGEGASSQLCVRFIGLKVCRSRSRSSFGVEAGYDEEMLDWRRAGDWGVVGPLALVKTDR